MKQDIINWRKKINEGNQSQTLVLHNAIINISSDLAQLFITYSFTVSEVEYDTPSNKHYWNGVTLTRQKQT